MRHPAEETIASRPGGPPKLRLLGWGFSWSSFRHYLTGDHGIVEIESEWTGRKRERMGIVPRVKLVTPVSFGDNI